MLNKHSRVCSLRTLPEKLLVAIAYLFFPIVKERRLLQRNVRSLYVVELIGIEPTTFWLQTRRSPN